MSPQPLPACSRTRECDHCGKQFRTRETIVEEREATVWKIVALIEGRRSNIAVEDIPEGEWSGIWTAFEVLCNIDGVEHVLHTRSDMRVPAYPCRVICDERGLRIISGVADDE